MTEVDEFSEYLNVNVAINMKGSPHPFLGKVVELNDLFVVLLKRDGRTTKIRRRAVDAIEPIGRVDGDGNDSLRY
jgi:hypothetical protein